MLRQRTWDIQIFLNGESEIGVRFPYDIDAITELKQIPGHRWHPKEQYWSFPSGYDSYARLLKIFERREIQIDPELKSRFGVNEKKKELPQVDQKVVDDSAELRRFMRLKNYSNKTIKSYCSCMRHFANYSSPRHLQDMTSRHRYRTKNDPSRRSEREKRSLHAAL